MADKSLLENEAKRALTILSENLGGGWKSQDDWLIDCLPTAPKDPPKLMNPIRQTKRTRVPSVPKPQERPVMVLRRVSLENHEFRTRKPSKKTNKQNIRSVLKPDPSRSFYSITKNAEQKQSEVGIDYMHYWLKHRFQDGSIQTLVERLKGKRNTFSSLQASPAHLSTSYLGGLSVACSPSQFNTNGLSATQGRGNVGQILNSQMQPNIIYHYATCTNFE